MSSDNAWYIQGSSVYTISMTLYREYMDEAERDFRLTALSDGPAYSGIDHQDAKDWAFNNYTPHGVLFIEDEED